MQYISRIQNLHRTKPWSAPGTCLPLRCWSVNRHSSSRVFGPEAPIPTVFQYRNPGVSKYSRRYSLSCGPRLVQMLLQDGSLERKKTETLRTLDSDCRRVFHRKSPTDETNSINATKLRLSRKLLVSLSVLPKVHGM